MHAQQFSAASALGRHTFRDRLRAVECPLDLIDQIGGWKSISSIGNGYGEGYRLEKVEAVMRDVKIGSLKIPE